MILSLSENFDETYISQGTHGVVVKCKTFKNQYSKDKNIFEEGAVKLNIKYKSEKVIGISSLKELSFLLTISSPASLENTFTVKLNDFLYTELFDESFVKSVLNKISEGKYKELDRIHFQFNYYKYDLTRFIKTYRKSIDNTENLLRKLSEDMALGLFWCSLNKIVHRDFKMCNVLVAKQDVSRQEDTSKGVIAKHQDTSCKDNDRPSAVSLKLCDFGLACYLKKARKNKTASPGVTSIYFRSPEIHDSSSEKQTEYDYKIDYWALGIVFLNLIYSFSSSTSASLIDLKIEKKKKQEDIDKMIDYYKNEISKRKTSSSFSLEFVEKYFSLIKSLIVLDPSKRFDIKQILKANCFDKNRIKTYKKLFKEESKKKKEQRKQKLDEFIKDKKNFYMLCEDRIKIMKKKVLLYSLYLSLNGKESFFWYKDEIIYHSLYTFDKLCIYYYSNDGRSNDNNNKGDGKSKNKENIYDSNELYEENLSFVYILYIFYKFFSTLINIDYKSFINSIINQKEVPWFSLKKLKIQKTKENIEDIEKKILEIYNLQLYEKTDFERALATEECSFSENDNTSGIVDNTSSVKLKQIEKYFKIPTAKNFSPLQCFILNEFFSL